MVLCFMLLILCREMVKKYEHAYAERIKISLEVLSLEVISPRLTFVRLIFMLNFYS